MMSLYIGIDPGVGGGMAALTGDGRVFGLEKMPPTEMDILDTLTAWSAKDNCHGVLEFVRSSPQMGVVSAFSFGKGYGGLRMALLAANIPFDEATPLKWQSTMQCRSRGDKNVTKARASELFPKEKITHAIADALLLAEYCRRCRILPT